MPPALANDLAYCSLRNERQTPTAGPPPKGPSPWMPANTWLNMELRNCASKLTAAVRALVLQAAAASVPGPALASSAALRDDAPTADAPRADAASVDGARA